MQHHVRVSLAGILIVAALVAPFTLAAQTVDQIQTEIQSLLAKIQELNAKIAELKQQQPPQASSTPQALLPAGGMRHRLCAMLIRNLREGTQGEDVQALQEFLQLGGWLNTNPTGFFGSLTREALKKWQAQSGIVSSGNAETTGWGVVGPRTRAFLGRWCSGLFTNPVATTTVATSSLSLSGVVSTSTTAGNQPPIISNVEGPSTLPVEIEGKWTILATDPEGGPLSYSIVWGDGDAAFNELLLIADSFDFVSTSIFTHAYDIPGFYKLVVRVRDNAGGVSLANVFVQVRSTEAFINWFFADDNGGGGNGTGTGNDTGENGVNGGSTIPGTSGSASSDAKWAALKALVADPEKLRQDIYTGGCAFTGMLGEKCTTPKQADGSCWFRGTLVKNGSWVVAYEKASVPGAMYNQPCKTEIRTCKDGNLGGSYTAVSCIADDVQRAMQNY